MSIWKSPVLYIGLLLVLLVGGALAAPFVIDWNSYRDDLEAYGHKLTGRDVKISGPVAVRLFPWPRLEAQFVKLANAPGFGTEPLASAEKMTVHLNLAALFSGQVKVERIDLDWPEFNLALDKAGNGNWHLAPEAPQGPMLLLGNVQLEQINIKEGRIGFSDARHALARSLTNVNGLASAAVIEGPWRFRGAGKANGTPLDISFSSSAYQSGAPLKFALRAAPQDGALPELSFDGEGQGDTYTGKINLDPVITQDGRSSLQGAVKPLAFQAKVDVKGDVAKFSAIKITAADPKDSGTLIEGDGKLDMSHGAHAELNLTAPHVDLDGLAGGAALRVWHAGGVMALANAFMAQFPEALDVTLNAKAAAVQAAGENLENVSVAATVSQGAIRVQDLTSDLPGRSRMKFSGIMFPGEGAAELGGNLAFESSDTRAFAQWLWPEGKDDIASVWNGQRGRLKAQSDVNWGGKRFGFQNFQYELDSLPGKAELGVTLGNIPALDLKLSADSFDLGSYVSGGLAGLSGAQGLLGLIPGKDSFSKRVDLSFGKLAVNGVEAKDVALNFDSSPSGLEMKSFGIGAVEGAEVKGNGLILMGADGPSGDIKFAVGAPRPQGLMRLLGLLPAGPDPRWAGGLGATDLRADVNVKPGKDEPLVSYSINGSSGPFKLVSSGTAQQLEAGANAVIGFSGTLSSPDARDVLKLAGLVPQGAEAGDGTLSLTVSGNPAMGYKTAVNFDGLGLQAGFSGNYRRRADGLGLTGTFKLSGEEGKPLLTALGWPVYAGSAAPLNAGAEVAAAKDGLVVKSATLEAGKQKLTASGRMAPGGVLKLDVVGGSFRMQDLVALAASPWGGEGAWPNGTFDAGWPFGLSGEIWLRPNALADPLGAPLGESVIGLSSGPEGRSLSLVARASDGGAVNLDASLKPSSAGQVLKAQLRYPFLLRNIFAKDGKPVGLLGSSVLEGTFTSEGRSPAVMLANLVGSGTLQSPDARVNGLAPDPFYAAIKDVKSADEIQKAFAALTSGDGIDIGQVSLPFSAKDGAMTFQAAQAATSEAQIAVTPGIDLSTGVISAAVIIDSRAQPELPPMTITYQGLPGETQTRADTAALASKLGTALINKDMEALDKLQREQAKAEQDAAAQAEADKAKYDAFQAQRTELRLQQRMLKVFAQQRALDAARYKAALDAAIAAGQAMDKEEKRRLLGRLK
jgi:hypothetical protein